MFSCLNHLLQRSSPSSLPLSFFFMSLKVTVYVPSLWYYLNMSPFPQGGHCRLSRLTASPSLAPGLLACLPLPRCLHFSICDISGRHLLVDLPGPFSACPLTEAVCCFQAVHDDDDDRGIELPSYSLKRLSAISAILCPLTPPP